MSRKLVLLRGVNVSGHNKVPMADLRRLLTERGLDNVATYIQSGNIAVDYAGDPPGLTSLVEGLLVDEFDVHVPVVTVEQAVVPAILADAPFAADADPAYQLIYFADAEIDRAGLAALDRVRYAGDEISPGAGAVYVSYENGQSKSKLTLDALERAAGCTLTGRNIRSVAKLIEL